MAYMKKKKANAVGAASRKAKSYAARVGKKKAKKKAKKLSSVKGLRAKY
jgi:hypothetical protein